MTQTSDPHDRSTAADDPLCQARRDWLLWLKHERRLSDHTSLAYQQDVDAFFSFLVNHRGEALNLHALAQLTAGDIRAYLARRRAGESPLSDRSVARVIASLRSFFSFLDRRRGLINTSIRAVSGPKIKPPIPRAVSPEAAFELIDLAQDNDSSWVGARDAAVLTLLYGCGLRISEVLSLTGMHKDLPPTLRIVGKGQKTRLVPTLPAARDAVTAYVTVCPFVLQGDGPLFRGVRGGPLRARIVQASMVRMRGQLGLAESATPHAMRHAFATHLLQSGGDLRSIQELLGHASLSTTQRYMDVDSSQMLAVFARAHPRA
ncbi:tyrosine recombinase XerC [Candidatus Phycosocius spiralis]|uniref:Tyrosine recombinase XerC n=1 Tax=Candidatus Phycosocius spiralis TaxID=2815099 RepID=A0ABQ4PV26_9PROT|nr:tyrosine recombinase XerC [Candidatus Phycosocius spiralis]GIU66816.1 tyrosine recombinase XerC [Candidatus Phycosocius spiralis]